MHWVYWAGILPDDLFGRKIPICRLQLVGDGHIIAPHWLFCGVTHFTSGESIGLPKLLDILRNMSALVYFGFRGCLDGPHASPIQMPQLTNLTVCTYSPREFILLNQVILLHVGVKR